MASYIRKVKTKSGGIAVQIEHKQGRRRVGITHIGTAHSGTELKILMALAYEKMHEGQLSFAISAEGKPSLRLQKSFSALFWDTLENIYGLLGFEDVGDPVLNNLSLQV